MLILLFLYILIAGFTFHGFAQISTTTPSSITIVDPTSTSFIQNPTGIDTNSESDSTATRSISFDTSVFPSPSATSSVSSPATSGNTSVVAIGVGVSIGATAFCVITLLFVREIRAGRIRKAVKRRRRRLAELPANKSGPIGELYAGGYAWQAELEGSSLPHELPTDRRPELE